MPLDRSIDVNFDTPDVSIILNSNVYDPGYAWGVPRSLDRARDGVDRDEIRSLAYYRTRVSNDICSYFDTDFWYNLVLQVSEEEPIVRHALLALSALYEAGETSQLLNHPSSNDRYNTLMRFAIYHHNNAISTLLRRIGTDGPLLEVLIMTCLIFTWIEFVRDNVDDSLRHLHSGLRILCEQRQLIGSRVVIEHMAKIVGRVLIQATLHRSSSIEFDYYATVGHNPVAGTLSFTTLREARCDIDGKISSALHFLRRIEGAGFAELRHKCCAFPDLPCLKCMHQTHIHEFDQWKVAFESLRDRLNINALTADALQALHQLELSYLLISNTFDTLFATTPMVFDKYNDVYGRILYLSRWILQHQVLRRSTSLFTFPFGNGVQGALLNIVLRCRHLPIRREAVHLLQLCPDNEGIWQRTSLITFCNWKINIEEKGRPRGALETDPLPENARVYAERAREVVRESQTLVAISFKRGAWSSISDVELDEEVVPNVSMRLVGLLGMRGALSLRPAVELKAQNLDNKNIYCSPTNLLSVTRSDPGSM